MTRSPPLSSPWKLLTFFSSTGLFDQSFTETVIDYADFNAADTAKWWRVDGGMQNLTDAMARDLASTTWPSPGSAAINVKTKSPVVALSHDKTKKKINVTIAGKQPVAYDMVFNTTAMGPCSEWIFRVWDFPTKLSQPSVL